jgi:putative peptide zinc metalloprotease protein
MGNQAGGNVPTRTDAAGRQIPLNATYEARSTIDDPDGVIGIGYRGRARVKAGWQTLGNRIFRYLARTFHFYL